MKKIILTVLAAIIIGTLFGLWYFKGVKNEVASALSINNTINAFQVGVYKNYDNALNEKNKYDSAIIIADGEFYRVYIGLSSDGIKTEYLKQYFDNKGYLYYIRKVIIPDNFLDEFETYQELLLKTEEVDLVNKKILEEYSKRINGV